MINLIWKFELVSIFFLLSAKKKSTPTNSNFQIKFIRLLHLSLKEDQTIGLHNYNSKINLSVQYI
jgi:hypothetical protein